MGSDNGNYDERPAHPVYLDSYWIDQTEVTNKMYTLCVQDKVCSHYYVDMPSETRSSYYNNPEFENYPVIFVTWDAAKTYCEWTGRRLPTESEWEKAARGPSARTYPWGNELPDTNFLNYQSTVGDTTKVGSYPKGASIYGALDMAGNVWEWVSSLYLPYPYFATDGRENSSVTATHVIRGGSWFNNMYEIYSSYRDKYYGWLSRNGIGFRCALSAE